jgi:hypothetical protein
METSASRRDQHPVARPVWSAPRLARLNGRHDVTVGIAGGYDGISASTVFTPTTS